MKYLQFIFLIFLCGCATAQQDVMIEQVTDSTYYLNLGEPESPEGVDSATLVIELLNLIEAKQNQKGRRMYQNYVADIESKQANKALNQFQSDTSYIPHIKSIVLPFLKGDWIVRGDTAINAFTITPIGRIVGNPPARVIPLAKSHFELRNSDFGETLNFFRDPTARNRKFIAIRDDGSRVIIIQK